MNKDLSKFCGVIVIDSPPSTRQLVDAASGLFSVGKTQLFVKRFTAITAKNDCKSHSSRCKLETYKTDKQSINLSNPQVINLI